MDDKNFVGPLWKNNGGGHYTHQNDLYFKQLKKLNFYGGKILEIGPGKGDFALKIFTYYRVEKYRVLDIEKNIQDSISTLKEKDYKVETTLAQNYKTLFDLEFDLIVSNVCIPETPKTYREDLLNNMFSKTNHAMIIGQLNGNWDKNNEYERWIKKLFSLNFKYVQCNPIPYKNCYAMLGSNKIINDD